MGILDDAIKEHLELKRRRGADPNEVERLEREALGPVRRGGQASEEAVLEDDGLLEEDGLSRSMASSNRKASRCCTTTRRTRLTRSLPS